MWWARYRNERSTWRNPTVRHIAAQGNVSGFFRHFDGDDKDMENMEKRRQGEEGVEKAAVDNVAQEAGLER